MQAVFPSSYAIFSFLSDFGIYVPQDSFDIVWNYIMLNPTELRSYPFPPPLSSVGMCIFIKVMFLYFVSILRVHTLSPIGWKLKMFSLHLLSTTQATPTPFFLSFS